MATRAKRRLQVAGEQEAGRSQRYLSVAIAWLLTIEYERNETAWKREELRGRRDRRDGRLAG
jgi:hypothetical protein